MKTKKYKVYNGFSNNLLVPDPVVEATSARQAVEKVLKDSEINFASVKRGGGNDVQMRTWPVAGGRAVWWTVLFGGDNE